MTAESPWRHWRRTGWMAVVGDGLAGEEYSWIASCQTQSFNFSLDDGPIFRTREECEAFIRDEVLAANKMYDRDELPPAMVRL